MPCPPITSSANPSANPSADLPPYFLTLAALLGGLGVAAGAFGAHGLKPLLTPDALAVYETAVRYQMYHALALLGLGMLPPGSTPTPWRRRAGYGFLLGILLFSGSLYAMTLTGWRSLGWITPCGGVAFLAGWACLARHLWPRRK